MCCGKIKLVKPIAVLGKIHPGIVSKGFVIGPDSKRFAYGVVRGRK